MDTAIRHLGRRLCIRGCGRRIGHLRGRIHGRRLPKPDEPRRSGCIRPKVRRERNGAMDPPDRLFGRGYCLGRRREYIQRLPGGLHPGHASRSDYGITAGPRGLYAAGRTDDTLPGETSAGGPDAFLSGFGQAIPPRSPTNLRADPGDATVALAWDPPSFDGGFLITNYTIYRGTSSTSPTRP